MAEKDLLDNLCESVDIIIQKRLEGLSYDKTVLCTITDITNRDKGEYVVSEGSTKFKAYSENTTYREGMSVYVIIPMGDYNQKKIITGKYISDDAEAFTWVSPLDSFVELNIMKFDSQFGLLANDKEIIETEYLINQEISPELFGYERLGMSAEFMTELGQYYTIAGNYGLEIVMTNSDNVDYTVYLDSADMWGNPYNFKGWFAQEKAFDISSIGAIKHIKARLYQKANFINNEEKEISHTITDAFGNSIKLPNNIFARNLRVSFGYSLENIKNEQIQLVTAQSKTYNATSNLEEIKKKVEIRWVYKKDNQYVVISDDNSKQQYLGDEDISIKWYRKNVSPDVFSETLGNFWEEVQISGWDYTFIPDITLPTEKIKVVIEVGENKYISNELVFENETETEKQNIDLIKALTLGFPDKDMYNGVFRIYNGETGKLVNSKESFTRRKIEARYNSIVSGEDYLDTAESIVWKIPIINTMIQTPELGIEYIEGENVSLDEEGFMLISRTVEQSETKENPSLIYRIKDHFSPSYTNNTIYCTVVKNGLTYNAQLELFFGASGTMGSDYFIDFRLTDEVDKDGKTVKPSVAAVDVKSKNYYRVEANLYDHENKIVENVTFKFSWLKEDGNLLKMKDAKEETNYVDVYWNRTTTSFKPLQCKQEILCAKTRVSGRTLKAYLPIASVHDAEKIMCIEGATSVIYDATGGNAAYYKKGYRAFAVDGNPIEPLTAIVRPFGKDDKGVEKNFQPTISEEGNILRPKALFIDNIDTVYYVELYSKDVLLWSQPLYIAQNPYSSTLLNQWEGDLTIDEENGIILSTMMGAGKKNSNNTFSGVLMGDIQQAGTNEIGLFGYHNGIQSYGFNIDGTAFIGKKSSGGYIEFDGNDAEIILINGLNKIVLSSKGAPSAYFQVFGDYEGEQKQLINIANKSYWLQSANYDEEAESEG